MLPVRQTITAPGALAVVPLDIYISPFSVSIAVTVGSAATADYKLQFTYDDVWDSSFNPATAQWFDSSEMTGESTSTFTTLTAPVTAVRINATAYSGAAGRVAIIQAGLTGV